MTRPVLVRMEEVRAAPGGTEAVLAAVHAELAAMAAAGGFLGGEAFRAYDGPERVVLLSRWRDVAALTAYAGPDWRRSRLAGGAAFAREAHAWHFVPAD